MPNNWRTTLSGDTETGVIDPNSWSFGTIMGDSIYNRWDVYIAVRIDGKTTEVAHFLRAPEDGDHARDFLVPANGKWYPRSQNASEQQVYQLWENYAVNILFLSDEFVAKRIWDAAKTNAESIAEAIRRGESPNVNIELGDDLIYDNGE